jgi:hypothetical protein
MDPLTAAGHGALAIDLNSPGSYLNWSIFTISVANLVLIAVMVVIFGAALLLPFPGRHEGRGSPGTGPAGAQAGGGEEADSAADVTAPEPVSATDPDSRMWTARLRRRALAVLPPGKLLPDQQPAYVASWIYVFGVASLAALGMAIVSGFTIALGGTDWWHTNPVGHFCNSMHLWSVELFMAFMVIHLWGKFWMAAWRGRRWLTWMTGVVAFVASVVECFTGYLSQQNFDSQWIATNGKDAFNAVGVGAFFNLMNFGQMLLWHVVLIPVVLIALVGAHVLLVRVRGVSHPLPTRYPRWQLPQAANLRALASPAGRKERRARRAAEAAPWRGPTRRYDILKEGAIAALVALILTVGLASVLSSPDVPPVTLRSWVQVAPADFLGTAANELDGTSGTAGYGPPYNNGGTPQSELFAPANISGVRQPIDTAQTFVLAPLAKTASTDPQLAAALSTYNAASAAQQDKWAANYGTAVQKVTFASGAPVVPAANDGPVPVMLATELTLARSGALDGDLSAQQPFYGTDFTRPLLFLADGQHYADQATAMGLTGDQWGVMNETGSYPGQPWLWLYQLWYHVPGWENSFNLDLIAIYMTGLGTLLLLFVPFIPGLRDIPRLIPVHRLIWRSWGQRPGSAPDAAVDDRPARPSVTS